MRRIAVVLVLTAFITWYAGTGQNNPFSPSFVLAITGATEGICISGPSDNSPAFWVPPSAAQSIHLAEDRKRVIAPDSGAFYALDTEISPALLVLDTCTSSESDHPRSCIGLRAELSDMRFRRLPSLSEGSGPVEIIRKEISMLVWHNRWGEINRKNASHYREQYDIILVIDIPDSSLHAIRTVLRPQKMIRAGNNQKKDQELNIISAGKTAFRYEIARKSDSQIKVIDSNR